MELFRMTNTEGYTRTELDALNQEWKQRVLERGLEEFTEEYDEEADRFCDEVARR